MLVPDSVVIHKESAKKRLPKIFLGKKSLRIPYNKFWLTYYGRRNLVWLGKKFSTKVSAYVDGLKGNFDNEKPKRILYENSNYFYTFKKVEKKAKKEGESKLYIHFKQFIAGG